MVMTSDVQAALKQRFPIIMVDSVSSLESGKSIRTLKNVTTNELHGVGHFKGNAVMPSTLVVEAIGQSASILFAKTTGMGAGPDEFLVLGSINEMTFLKPVIAGDRMEIQVSVCKFIADFAIVEAVVSVDQAVVAKGKLGFARRVL
jgi:3-hydroxyacyl-[acyl-carrier-protein] dehydratase